MTMTNLDRTKALEAAATRGPWEIVGGGELLMPLGIDVGSGTSDVSLRTADAEFIAHARTAVPALVAAVERVQAQRAQIIELLGVVLPYTAVNDKTRVALMQLFQIHDEITALETP